MRIRLSESESGLAFPEDAFDLDELLNRLHHLSLQATSRHEFYRHIVQGISTALSGYEFTFWEPRGAALDLIAESHTGIAASLEESQLAQFADLALAARVSFSRLGANQSWILACPIVLADEKRGLLVGRLGNRISDEARVYLRSVAEAFAEIAEDFEIRRRVKHLQRFSRQRLDFERGLIRIHRARSAVDVAREMASQIRDIAKCDRVAMLDRHGRTWQLMAVSSVFHLAPRSEAVSALERLVTGAACSSTSHPIDSSDKDLPTCVREDIDAYQEASHARHVIIVPSRISDSDGAGEEATEWTTAIVLENFDGVLPPAPFREIQQLIEHGVTAYSWRHQRRWWTIKGLVRNKFQVASLAAICVLLAGVAACLLLMSSDLRISAQGILVPQERSNVYAPMDSTVKRILVTHGQEVEKGKPLVELQSLPLQLEIDKAQAALASSQNELESLRKVELRASLPGASPDMDPSTIAARILSLEEQILHDRERSQLLAEQMQQLVVLSPMAGKITNWNPEGYLRDRPLRRGQRLLEIANTEGEWLIEIAVPDSRTGHLLRALQEGTVDVEFVTMSNPSRIERGQVIEYAMATQVDENDESTLRVVVRPEGTLVDMRSGMTVMAKLNCGTQPLGYVWFHEAIEVLQRSIF